MELILGYQDNPSYRRSFNELARNTFGIDFEDWYGRGYWSEYYIPYSFVDEGKVVANVSVSRMRLLLDGAAIEAVQIGTVMTAPRYRRRGLFGSLIRTVLSQYRKKCEFIYLFANESVGALYPRFGFQRVLEHQAITEEAITGNGSTEIQKLNLDNSDDWRLFCGIIAASRPVSQKLSHLDGQWLIMFHCLSSLGSKVYYLPKQEIVVIKENIDNVTYIYDIFCRRRYEIDSVIEQIAGKEPKYIRFGFTPHESKHKLSYNESGEILFMCPASISFEKRMFPVMSHT